MSSSLRIETVRSTKQWKSFYSFPWKVYQGDPLWVPPLFMDMKELFDQKNNPFFNHAEIESFLAYQREETVGRIVGVVNRRHNEIHGERTGFFGFFECLPDRQDAANALFGAAADWCRQRGMTALRGPACFSTNDDYLGFLADGFDRSPYLMMSYNPRFYLTYAESSGFRKAKDLYAFRIDMAKEPPVLERIKKVAERYRRRHQVVIRKVNMKNFNHEVDFIKDVYNHAWNNNWGFVPMTNEEMNRMAKKLKPVAFPEIMLLAEINGRPAGAALGLPDYNEIIKSFNGTIGPIKLLKLLWSKSRLKRARGFIVGVKEEFRKSGLNALLLLEFYEAGMRLGYSEGEVSWTLEDNELINRDIESMGAERYKTYRLVEKAL